MSDPYTKLIALLDTEGARYPRSNRSARAAGVFLFIVGGPKIICGRPPPEKNVEFIWSPPSRFGSAISCSRETKRAEGLTGALLDRLTHHVHILEMNGDSYRLKQSKQRQRRT